VLSFIAFVHL